MTGGGEVRHSVCALDCPDCCSILVRVENGRATKLRGNPLHPITRGFLCAKVTRYLERVYHPDRLLYPQKRVGAKGQGRFVRISWDEALDIVTENLHRVAAQYGPEAILPYSYAGTMGLLNGAGMDRRFFHRLGASRLDRTICAAAGTAGLTQALGFRYGTEPEQFRHSKFILAWGANILGTNPHLWPFIQEARRNGAKFYAIDPVKNRTGELADRWFGIYPGSDLALALGLMHVIFRDGLEDRDYLERHTKGVHTLRDKSASYTPQRVAALTGIPAEDIESLAHEYAQCRPAAIRLNYGLQRSERGATAVRAIAYLPVLTGSWKDVGGGLLLSTSQAFHFNRTALEMPELQQKSPLGRAARILNMSELGRLLTEVSDPPVYALFVYNSNPLAVAPHQNKVRQGLAREDLFTVVLEQFQTDTADYADILLPATTFLEHTDLYLAYGHYYLQLARAVLDPPGEAKSNVEVFRLLARRMGFQEPCFEESEEQMIRALLASEHPFLAGITWERLERESFVRLNLAPPGQAFQPFASGGYGSPDGRCELQGEGLDYVPPVESRFGDEQLRSRYPLELISSKNDNSMNSTFGHRDSVDQETAQVWIHVADAAPRGVQEADLVRVFNDRGECFGRARLTENLIPGVIRIPSVRWGKRSPQQQNVNALTSDRLTDFGGGPTFYNCLVQVERCGD
ncbi:MAG: molybdopterin-dependent oxidoreductase [Bryobacteraceae bacterium]|nr:molybdopterin-dependent oxidoreductase [Bryobacteraceae bacterium]MDW8376734.1 molybdopterin-dependent oxidoreductase [Bryobacterales bacterium]